VRQHEIGRYTVDFAIHKARLAIEIDGGVHNLPGRGAYDATRQAHLEGLGWRFVRFTSDETLDATHILGKVRDALPLPLRGGGRGWGEAPTLENAPQTAARFTDETKPANAGAAPRPLTPSPRGEGEFPERRTRDNRTLKPRRTQ
jgi:hypothetical protein